jgi:hypothetical protein
VCLLIITILVSLMLTGLRRSRDAARDVGCQSQLRQLSLIMMAYAADYKTLPIWGTIGAVPALELRPIEWSCPADRLHPANEQGSSYAYLASLYMGPHPDLSQPQTIFPQAALRAYENNPKLPLYWDFDLWHGYRNTGYWDGGVERWRD